MKTRITCPKCSPCSAVDFDVWQTLDPVEGSLYWFLTCKKCKNESTVEFGVTVFLGDEVWNKIAGKKETYNNKGLRV